MKKHSHLIGNRHAAKALPKFDCSILVACHKSERQSYSEFAAKSGYKDRTSWIRETLNTACKKSPD